MSPEIQCKLLPVLRKFTIFDKINHCENHSLPGLLWQFHKIPNITSAPFIGTESKSNCIQIIYNLLAGSIVKLFASVSPKHWKALAKVQHSVLCWMQSLSSLDLFVNVNSWSSFPIHQKNCWIDVISGAKVSFEMLVTQNAGITWYSRF